MSPPEPDYPAAHSMDTSWFAVDRDGHVGYFESGENGAVPVSAATEDGIAWETDLPEQPYSLLEWLGDAREEQHVELSGRDASETLGPTLLFLDALDRVRAEVDRWDAEHAPSTVGVAVLFRDLPAETARRLHEAGACLGCFAWDLGLAYGFSDDLATRVGFFRYAHDEDVPFSIAAPYRRARPPADPIRIDQLPPEIREAIGRLRLDHLSFFETERIQPVDHAPCLTHADAYVYLDLDGRTIRPIPGREAELNRDHWSSDLVAEFFPEFRVAWPDPPGERS